MLNIACSLIFAYAGLAKIAAPRAWSQHFARLYRVFMGKPPNQAVRGFGSSLPWMEILLSLTLLATPALAVGTSVLVFAFSIVGIGLVVKAKHAGLACGCFGNFAKGATRDTVWRSIALAFVGALAFAANLTVGENPIANSDRMFVILAVLVCSSALIALRLYLSTYRGMRQAVGAERGADHPDLLSRRRALTLGLSVSLGILTSNALGRAAFAGGMSRCGQCLSTCSQNCPDTSCCTEFYTTCSNSAGCNGQSWADVCCPIEGISIGGAGGGPGCAGLGESCIDSPCCAGGECLEGECI